MMKIGFDYYIAERTGVTGQLEKSTLLLIVRWDLRTNKE